VGNGTHGLFLDTAHGDDWLEPVVFLANRWAQGHVADAPARIERGEDVMEPPVFARRADAPFEAARTRWRERTGQDVGDDAVVVSTSFLTQAVVLPRRALLEILREFERRRGETPALVWQPPPPALFAVPSASAEPHAGEESLLRVVEDLAEVNDLLARQVDVLDTGFIVERRRVVAHLTDHGLLDPTHAEQKRRWLVAWALPSLLRWHDAAMALSRYLASPERAAYELPPPPADPLASAVSLDWFRVPSPPPEGVAPFDWLGLCERVPFVNPPDTPRLSGEIMSRIQGRWYRLQWRRDDCRTPVVLRTEPM
jgi:hypothetical protein